MYRILVVDDEKKEREGIALLIKRYHFDFEVTLAQNGEEALGLLEKTEFDVLLTDIKMPHMNGIQLIEEARRRNQDLICIIYSAYGEFEYAQNAISLGVTEYLLKPIRLDLFEKLFQEVITLCEEKEKQKELENRLYQEHMEWMDYQKKKKFLSFLDGGFEEEKDEEFIEFSKYWCIPLLISEYSNLFSRRWEAYERELRDILEDECTVINIDDNLTILLLLKPLKREGKNQKEPGRKDSFDILEKCKKIADISRKKYQTDVFIIIGNGVNSGEALKREYEQMKAQLDYQFFMSESTIFMQNELYYPRKEHDMIPLYLERIYNCTKVGDLKNVRREFEKMFDYLESQKGFSSIYIKYTFTDAIKKMYDYADTNDRLMEFMDRIYYAKSVEDVRKIISDVIDIIGEKASGQGKESHLVQMTKRIIYERYGDCNLGVAVIANELGVSAAYLSSLFKMETGTNLSKFITGFRIDKSKELLRQSNLKVNDIAKQVGYVNLSYYSSLFRNMEGCSPGQYRETEEKQKRESYGGKNKEQI